MMKLKVVLLAALVLTAISTCASTEETGSVHVSYSIASEYVPLEGPVIIEFKVQNNLEKTISIDVGPDLENFVLTITSPDSTTVSFNPPVKEGLAPLGIIKLEPGHAYTRQITVTRWFLFNKPGNYQIDVSLTTPIRSEDGQQNSVEITGNKITVEIGNRDQEYLKTLCSKLLNQISTAKSYQEAEDAATILSSVNDSVAVPFLKQAAGLWHLEPIVVPALGRIGNTAAVDSLILLLKTGTPDARVLARSMLARIESRTPDRTLKERIRLVLQD